jgi:hypothetical protein
MSSEKETFIGVSRVLSKISLCRIRFALRFRFEPPH